jgi:hypothetical protein
MIVQAFLIRITAEVIMFSRAIRLFVCFAVCLLFIQTAAAQPIIQHMPTCYGINLALMGEHSRSTPGWLSLTSDPNSSNMLVGKSDSLNGNPDRWAEYRFAYQWALKQDSIPYGSTIKAASITIEYVYNGAYPTLYLYKVGYPLSVSFDDQVWSQIEGTSIGHGTGGATSLTLNFDSLSVFVDSLQAALSDSVYDNIFRLGVRAQQGANEYKNWTNTCCNITLTIQFTPPGENVMITNVVHGIEHYALGDSYVRGDQNVWNSNGTVNTSALPVFERPPVYKDWLLTKNHVAETWFARHYLIPDSVKEKYHDWNTLQHEHNVHCWITPFTKNSSTQYRNHSRDVFHADIDANIELYIPKDSIPFEFQDPWRVVQDKTTWDQVDGDQPDTEHRTPYVPWDDPTTLGIFLSQDWRFGLEYYSIRPWRYLEHQSTHTYEKKSGLPLAEGDGIFLGEIVNINDGWRFNDQAAVTTRDVSHSYEPYRQTDMLFNTDYSVSTMLYKAHMLSDIEEIFPTQRCNQRRIDRDELGVYHAVYESAGEIWYTQSTDGGSTWSPEELVSEYNYEIDRPTPGAINPSIAVLDSCVYVVYYEDGDIYLRSRYKGTWDPSSSPVSGNDVLSNATPVIDVGRGCQTLVQNPHMGEVVLIVWEGSGELRYTARWYWFHVFQDQIWDHRLALQVNDQPRYPSIINLIDGLEFGVAWRDASEILYHEVTVWNCRGLVVNIDPLETASDAGDSCVYAPSLTHDYNGYATLVYEAMTLDTNNVPYSFRWINVRTRSLNGWETTDYTVPSSYDYTRYGDPLNPTIGAHEAGDTCIDGNISRGINVAYHKNWGGGTREVAIDCQATFDNPSGNASFPNMVPYASDGADLRQVGSYPHAHPLDNAVRCDQLALMKGAPIPSHLLKELRVTDGTRTVIHALSNPRFVTPDAFEQPLKWRTVHDTTVIGHNATVEGKTRTAPFTVLQGSSLRFDRMLYAHQGNGFSASMHLKLQLRDAATDNVLQERPIQANSLACDTAMWAVETVPLSSLAGHTVYACMSVGDAAAGSKVHVRNVLLEDALLPKASGERSTSEKPTGFILLQNSPNPFSGSTDIMFRVADYSYVRLTVRDLLGREIAVPADGMFGSGYHTVNFNASSLPAGVYLYTLQAGGTTITKRMTLTR